MQDNYLVSIAFDDGVKWQSHNVAIGFAGQDVRFLYN